MRVKTLEWFAVAILLSLAPNGGAEARTHDLPFRLYREYTIVVRGSINGQKNLGFIIDTGASPSVVDSRLAARLGLRLDPDQLSLFDRSISAGRVTLPNVDLGPLQVRQVTVLCEDLSSIGDALGERIDAMVGLDVLGHTNFRIDYIKHQIAFDPPPEKADAWAPFQPGDQFAVIDVQLGNTHTRLMVDTGALNVILFKERVRDRLPKMSISGFRNASNLAGRVRLARIPVGNAYLGSTSLGQPAAFLMDTPGELVPSFDGLLGVAALKPHRVDFDFKRGAVGWKW